MNPLKVAIIGGGLSGLATATHLRLMSTQRGVPVELTVFEASPRLGGVIHSERIDCGDAGVFIIDHGADMFATKPSAALELCRSLGVEPTLLRPNPQGRGAMIARGNQLVPIPEGFVLMRPTKLLSMLTTPLLSPRGKLRLLMERFVRRRPTSVQDESVGSFVRRRLGRECLDHIVAPLVAGIYTADVDRLSMAATMGPIWKMESSDGSLARATLRRICSGEDSTERSSSGARYEQFRAFPEGMQEFIQTLADAIGRSSIRTDCPVHSLRPTAAGIRINDAETFDHVVLTTPASVSAQLLRVYQSSHQEADSYPALDEVASSLESIDYASTAIVVMAIPRDRISRLPKTFGFVVPPAERRSILAGSFASEKFPLRAPENFVILRAFVGGVLNPEILQHSDDEIIDIVAGELGDLIGLDTTTSVQDYAAIVKVVRWNQAMPQYNVGHLDKVARIHTAMDRVPAITLMTNALGGVGISPIIAAAEGTARKILESNVTDSH